MANASAILPATPTPEGIPSPVEFGLPEKFARWRDGQWQAISDILDDPKRFHVACAPTGCGKSLYAMAAAVLSGRRTAILTSTLGLTDQYAREFVGISHDIRGMANYRCPLAPGLGMPSWTKVSEAPCQMGYRCPGRFDGSCEYYDRYRQAQRARIVGTTYACWMYDARKDKGAFHISRALYESEKIAADPTDNRIPVDLLIADEADLCGGWVSSYVGVDLSRRECLHLYLPWPDPGMGLVGWQQWAERVSPKVNSRLEELEWEIKNRNARGTGVGDDSRAWSKDLRHLREMQRKLGRLRAMKEDEEWVLDEGFEGNGHGHGGDGPGTGPFISVRFTPIEPARYAESVLWRGVEKIVLMSATIRPKTAHLLGISDDDMTFVEYPSTFDPKRRPVIAVRSGVQLNWRTERDDDKMRWWLNKLDQVIEVRQDRKGVVHGISYTRSRFIVNNSAHHRIMLTHNSFDRADKVAQFMTAPAPACLVSPSVDTGYSFDHDAARYIIIAKIPFPPKTDKLVKARADRDPEYTWMWIAEKLMQMTGRGMRAESDACETLILDDSWSWVFPRVRPYLTGWWLAALGRADSPPPPLVW